jgi:hypothetical protein
MLNDATLKDSGDSVMADRADIDKPFLPPRAFVSRYAGRFGSLSWHKNAAIVQQQQ